MYYYLVGLFDERTYKKMEKYQKELSNKYDLYTKLPKLHVTLEVIENPDLVKLNTLLDNTFSNYPSFSTKLDKIMCFNEPYKSVNIELQKSGKLLETSNMINTLLKSNGFNVRENLNDWIFHVSLANANFALKDFTPLEYREACYLFKDSPISLEGIIKKIELWKPINDENKMVVNSYLLN